MTHFMQARFHFRDMLSDRDCMLQASGHGLFTSSSILFRKHFLEKATQSFYPKEGRLR